MIDTMKMTVTTPTLTPRIVNADLSPVARQVEMKQISTFKKQPGAAHEQIALIVRAERAAAQKADCRRRHDMLPAEFRVAVEVVLFFLITGSKHPGIAEKPVFVDISPGGDIPLVVPLPFGIGIPFE